MSRHVCLSVAIAPLLLACPAGRSPQTESLAAQPSVLYVPTPPPETGSPLVSVLGNVGRIVTLPAADQAVEVVRLTDNFSRSGLPSDRLRLGLLLVLGDVSVRDDARAKALLDTESWEDLAYEALARLGLDLVDERRRHARDRLDATTALDEERKIREELEARLRAVEVIETDMNNREVKGTNATEAESPLR